MKKTLILTLLAVAALAHSQELFNDFQRSTTTEYDSVNKVEVVNTIGKSNFLVGNVDYQTQILRQIPITALYQTVAGGSSSAKTDDIFGAATYHYASGVWWNFASIKYTLPSGVVLPAQTAVLVSEDAIPTVQFETSGSHQFTTRFSSLSGEPTPGNLVLEYFAGGAWTQLKSIPVAGTTIYTYSLSPSGPYRVRWMLVRTGAAPAVAQINIILG